MMTQAGTDVAAGSVIVTAGSGGLSSEVSVPAAIAGTVVAGVGVNMTQNALRNMAAPQANEGDSPPHGGPQHNKAIDDHVQKVKDEGADNIRKNQQQVDKDGNVVGKIGPIYYMIRMINIPM